MLLDLRQDDRLCRPGSPIRKSPDQRLLGTSPKLIAATPRPSSPLRVKASTVRPWFPVRKPKNRFYSSPPLPTKKKVEWVIVCDLMLALLSFTSFAHAKIGRAYLPIQTFRKTKTPEGIPALYYLIVKVQLVLSG